MTAWLRSQARKQGLQAHWSLMAGSVAPDLPLVALTLNYFHDRGIFSGSGARLFGPEYNQLYFHDAVWIASHNMLHSPPPLLALLAIGYWFGVRGSNSTALASLWFALGCSLHSIVDIATHHNDGPLLLFPFDWAWRFEGPISYWDRRYYAGVVSPLEHMMDAGIVLALLWQWWLSYRHRTQQSDSRGQDVP